LKRRLPAKNPRENALNIIFLNSTSVYSSVAQWSWEVTWQKAGGQSGFKLQLSLVFFPVVVSFFPFFISWYHMFSFFSFFFLFFNLLVCFPFIPTAGALSELHEVCDKRISELLSMIRCNKN